MDAIATLGIGAGGIGEPRVPTVDLEHGVGIEAPRRRAQEDLSLIGVWIHLPNARLGGFQDEFGHLEHLFQFLGRGSAPLQRKEDLEGLRVGIREEVGRHVVLL